MFHHNLILELSDSVDYFSDRRLRRFDKMPAASDGLYMATCADAM